MENTEKKKNIPFEGRLARICEENRVSLNRMSTLSNVNIWTIVKINRETLPNTTLATVEKVNNALNKMRITSKVYKPSDWLPKNLCYEWIK
jgi:hypothetical protein